jgi:hypothetical protein
LRLTAAVLLGLLGSSFFWIKVLQERFLMAKTLIYEDIYLNYQLNFLLTPLQTYNESTIAVYDIFTLVYDIVLAVTVVMVIPIGILSLFQLEALKNRFLRSIWLILFISLFLTAIFSKPLWDNLSLLQEVQFPWRWLTIVSLFASILPALGAPKLAQWFSNKKKRPFGIMLLGTLLIGSSFSVAQTIQGAMYLPSNEVNSYVKSIENKEGFVFWWTIWTRKDFVTKNVDKISVDSRQTNILEWRPTERIFAVEEGQSTEVYVATFYHPNWHATVDGVSVEILPAEDGGILIPLSHQYSIVHLSFQESSFVILGRWASSIIWFCLFAIVLFSFSTKFTLPFNKGLPL